MPFNNNASREKFIGNRNLDEVIAQDTAELAEFGGSFKAIGDRMDYLIKRAHPTMITRGVQFCPFHPDCKEKYMASNCEYVIGGVLMNEVTAHLAREHHLLEKDNRYGISARQFYQFFMPEAQNLLMNPQLITPTTDIILPPKLSITFRDGRITAVRTSGNVFPERVFPERTIHFY